MTQRTANQQYLKMFKNSSIDEKVDKALAAAYAIIEERDEKPGTPDINKLFKDAGVLKLVMETVRNALPTTRDNAQKERYLRNLVTISEAQEKITTDLKQQLEAQQSSSTDTNLAHSIDALGKIIGENVSMKAMWSCAYKTLKNIRQQKELSDELQQIGERLAEIGGNMDAALDLDKDISAMLTEMESLTAKETKINQQLGTIFDSLEKLNIDDTAAADAFSELSLAPSP